MVGTDDPTERLDVITIGRCSVDLYGQQIGSRLEDITSFAKSVGGCPANIAIGTARLGLKSALLTRVGDEQMGRFIREQMVREGVETKGIATDPERLTALGAHWQAVAAPPAQATYRGSDRVATNDGERRSFAATVRLPFL